MTWSLQVSNGDLVLNGGKLGSLSGEAKLLQDLRHNLLEKMGTDPLHPEYGSLIDGGVRPNGQVVDSPIGETDFRFVTLSIESDIRYNRVTLSSGEILVDVIGVRFEQNMDALNVTVTIQTGSSVQNLNVALPPVVTI